MFVSYIRVITYSYIRGWPKKKRTKKKKTKKKKQCYGSVRLTLDFRPNKKPSKTHRKNNILQKLDNIFTIT